MSSKKFVYLLMTVAIVCGFIAVAPPTDSLPLVSFKGTVLNDDGTPAPGYAISGETGQYRLIPLAITSRADGTYGHRPFSIGGAKLMSAIK